MGSLSILVTWWLPPESGHTCYDLALEGTLGHFHLILLVFF